MELHEEASVQSAAAFIGLEDKFLALYKGTCTYQKSIYKNSRTHMTVTCVEHGDFTTTPNNHTKWKGCKQCRFEQTAKANSLSQGTILTRAEQAYNLVPHVSILQISNKLKGDGTSVQCMCSIHGKFTRNLSNHEKVRECPECLKEQCLIDRHNQRIEEARKLYDSKYIYTVDKPVQVAEKFSVVCPVHGEFTARMSSHLKGESCPKCAYVSKRRFKTSLEFKTFILEYYSQQSITFDKLQYWDEATEYCTNVTLTCLKHGDFTRRITDFKTTEGCCPSCSTNGFNPSDPAILYYLSINDGQAYKIGITNRTLDERFSLSELISIRMLSATQYSVGADAYAEEQRILKEYKMYKYNGPNLLKSGNTELFSKDVLNLEQEVTHQVG